jgi:two-component system, LytTR family, response regulator
MNINNIDNPIRVVLIDDEEAACINLKNILNDYINNRIDIVGVAHNTTIAEQLIHELQPDAVFLDIEMPGENAFQFLERIYPFSFEVIFVTAYDEYAIKAFKLNALDYILKPISIEELKLAVKKLVEKLKNNRLLQEFSLYKNFSEQLSDKKEINCLTIRTSTGVEIVDFSKLIYIEAQGSYCNLIYLSDAGEKSVVLSHSVADYEEILPTEIFFRTHRSYIVNIAHIASIKQEDGAFAVLNNKFNIPVSRRRYNDLITALNHRELNKKKYF